MKIQMLVERPARDIQGVIECFDRVVLFGTYQAIGWPGAMEPPLRGRGTSFMEFNKSDANQLRLELAEHVRTLARAEGIEIRQVNYGERKEAIVEAILAVRGQRLPPRGHRTLPVFQGRQESKDRLSATPVESRQMPALLCSLPGCGVWPVPPADSDVGALAPSVLR